MKPREQWVPKDSTWQARVLGGAWRTVTRHVLQRHWAPTPIGLAHALALPGPMGFFSRRSRWKRFIGGNISVGRIYAPPILSSSCMIVLWLKRGTLLLNLHLYMSLCVRFLLVKFWPWNTSLIPVLPTHSFWKHWIIHFKWIQLN